MDNDTLERYLRRPDNKPSDSGLDSEVEGAVEFGCFGWLRGVNARAIMLDLRRRDGDRMAISYSWIERVDFDPSVGISVTAGRHHIRIAGRNLNAEVRPGVTVYEGIVRHRIPWLNESASCAWGDGRQALVSIDALSW